MSVTVDPDPKRRLRIQTLFEKARDLVVSEREAFLKNECSDDEEMRLELEKMLDATEMTEDGFLEPPEFSDAIIEIEPDLAGRLLGTKIGKYRLKRVIASGGMGTVYEAVQENPHRVVALKMMRRNVSSRSALRRFNFETQLLGRLKHTYIARIYDAGLYDDGTGGTPYFVMEYIPGAKSITQYTHDKELSIDEKLQLFVKVCDAVHYGHQRTIIHRDLKPQNILVDSTTGEPKIIDYGVARATDSDLAVTTQQTNIGQLLGTMQYMSPEQCDADPHDIDTRSDVYSLGVVLYELLSGRRPYDTQSSTIYLATKIIKEVVPTPLSEIDRKLRGNIEIIVTKALEKDRDKRYQSAEDMKRDIERHLRCEPIEARSASAWLRTIRWVCRHPAVTTAAASVGIALLVLAATWGVVWYGTTQPMDFQPVTPLWSTAHLVSPFGKHLVTLGGESYPAKNVRVEIVDRPESFEGGRMALFTVRKGKSSTDGQLWMSELESLDKPIWQTDPFESFTPPAYPAAWKVLKEETVTDWAVASFFVANVLTDTPEDEIVVVHEPRTGSPWSIRIYDFRGKVLFEVWHMGRVKEIHWWEEAGLLVCAGDRHGKLDISLHGYSKTPFRWPQVVFALRPQRGMHVRGWLNEANWLQEWQTDANADVQSVLAWYKTLMPRVWKETFSVRYIFSSVPRGGRVPLVRISFASFASDKFDELGSFNLGLDAAGRPSGLGSSDAFYKSRHLLPEEDPYLTDWPPPPSESTSESDEQQSIEDENDG